MMLGQKAVDSVGRDVGLVGMVMFVGSVVETGGENSAQKNEICIHVGARFAEDDEIVPEGSADVGVVAVAIGSMLQPVSGW
mmetsp:Transcript_17281/g.31919  ORF Transcript_17281/g.31919 Transcript_17281/m.31919 type:complete len:81 (+) Transcript_17281:3244-3486(+)